jgi:FtsH-binding integral membrane protein
MKNMKNTMVKFQVFFRGTILWDFQWVKRHKKTPESAIFAAPESLKIGE